MIVRIQNLPLLVLFVVACKWNTCLKETSNYCLDSPLRTSFSPYPCTFQCRISFRSRSTQRFCRRGYVQLELVRNLSVYPSLQGRGTSLWRSCLATTTSIQRRIKWFFLDVVWNSTLYMQRWRRRWRLRSLKWRFIEKSAYIWGRTSI